MVEGFATGPSKRIICCTDRHKQTLQSYQSSIKSASKIMRSSSFLILLTTLGAASADSRTRLPFSLSKLNRPVVEKTVGTFSSVLDVRGGASKQRTKKGKTAVGRTATGKKKVGAAAKEEQSSASKFIQEYKKIRPLTRIYISMVGLATLAGLVLGEEMTQALMALDPMRVMYGFELWRPFTAASFLGPPSISWLMSCYYLFQYGSSLEGAYGSAQHLIFLISQLIFLSIASTLFGQPFFAQSMITAMLHVLSRAMPFQKVKWLIFTVPYWSLPYGLMASDVLQTQSAASALPHVLGILSGHFYQFHKFVWPKVGGQDWLQAPDFIVKRLDPDARKSEASESVSKALKTRKRNKGRKLGGK